MHSATCPSSSQPNQNRPHSATLYSPESQTDHITLAARGIYHVDSHLNEERAALLRRPNATQSPVMELPAETLSSIFEFACPPENLSLWHAFPSETEDSIVKLPNYQYPQFTLGAVSSRWRQVVRSNPRLWTWVALNFTPVNAEKKARFLRLFIEGSKEASFTIALNYSYQISPDSPYLVHKIIDKLLIEALPRIKNLHLINPPRQWHNHTLCLTQLNGCSLDLLRPSFVPYDHVILPTVAPLHRLSLQNALWRSETDIQLPWTTLTSLNLSLIPPDLSVQLFIQCPNLIDFHCHTPSYRQPPSEKVTLASSISFQRLASFRWEAYGRLWSRALIRHLHVPTLRDMYWNVFDIGTEGGDIGAFFARLPLTLTTLELGNSAISHLEYIPDALNIEFLVLHHPTTRDIRMLFRKLTPSEENGYTVKPFPRLKKVVLASGVRPENVITSAATLSASYADELVGLLEQRLDEVNNSFTLNTEATTLMLAPEILARLMELTSKGYKCRAY